MTRAAELSGLAEFREFIEENCAELQVDENTCYDLKLAVDEACTNIIQHGYAGMNPGSIMLELKATSGEVKVYITDFGHPFEPSSAPAPDIDAPLEARPLGGFGLFFIYQTMDEVDYRTSEEGNCLILTKRIDGDMTDT
jgi:anti-sigma regulatory factor (Ser/Thr protein kinase)